MAADESDYTIDCGEKLLLGRHTALHTVGACVPECLRSVSGIQIPCWQSCWIPATPYPCKARGRAWRKHAGVTSLRRPSSNAENGSALEKEHSQCPSLR